MLWFILLTIIILILLLLMYGLKADEYAHIPGPKGIFLIGNGCDFLEDSVKTYSNLLTLSRKYKDGFKLKLGHKGYVFLSHPGDAEALISSTKFNSKGYVYDFIRPWLKDGLLISAGAKWHQRRKVLTPAFHFNILRHFNSVLVEKTENLVEQLKLEVGNVKTDLYPFVTDFALNSICETAMGTTLDEQAFEKSQSYKKAIHTLGSYLFYRIQRPWMHLDIIFNNSPVGRHQKYILNLLTSFRNKVIKNRRNNSHYKNLYNETKDVKCDDEDDIFITKKKRLAMLDLLLEAERNKCIDAEGINEEVDTFMFEGYDTTATALEYMFMLLANHEDVQNKIVKEYKQIFGSSDCKPTMNGLAQMKYLEACIKESLRLYPPVHFISRKSDQPLQLKDFKCPAGTDYIIIISELHKRSDQFEEPLEFRPERFLKEPTWHPFCYLPFSAGPRNCIGQKFAMLEMKLAVSAVLHQYRLLPITRPQDLVFYVDIMLRPTKPMYVKIELRE